MNKLIVAVGFTALISTPAYAISDMLEGALYAVGITSGINYIVNKNQQTQLQEQQQREFYMRNRSEYPNFICYEDPIQCAYEQGVYDNAKAQWEKSKIDAYNCGRYGKDCQQP